MQTSLLWTGREYYSLEHCMLTSSDTGAEVDSVIVGLYQGQMYRVEYRIRTNPDWETVRVEINWRTGSSRSNLQLESDGKGNWTRSSQPSGVFKGCLDVDIPLTPFTNTLPINRLQLKPGDSRQIVVIYLDLLEGQIQPVRQQYTRLSDTQYHYQNVPNDFEAVITVDELGLVVDYPQLFTRTARQ
jgi:hypothetical protein